MADFEPVLTRNWNTPDAHTLKVYEQRGGYQGSRKAISEMADPDKVVGLVKDSELRGSRGRRVPHRPEVELPAQGSEGNLPLRQRR